MKRYQVILNPAAGHGNGQRALPAIERLLAQNGLTYELARSEYPGHAIELTRQAVKDGYDVIVAAGGDGTANEVINGLMQSKQTGKQLPALGILCAGRGNDFAHGAGIPEDMESACQVLAADQRRWIDIGRVVGGDYPQGRYFGNFMGVGFDAIVTIQVSKMPRWGGFLSFMLAVLETVFLYNHAPMATIEFGERTLTQRSLLISVMNGRQLGDGFIMAPNAEVDDGLLDLCIADQVNSFEVLRMIPYFMRGDQATQPAVKTGQAARVVITAHDGPLPAQVDGEIICREGKRLEVELFPRQIEVIYQPVKGKV
jgi:diacylglycerol kinase (ATP)